MDFIDQVRLQLSTMSQQEKDQWIVDRARLVEEDGQPGFLRSLSGEERVCDMPESGEIERFCDRVRAGKIYLEYESHYYEFDENGRYFDNWKAWHNDPFNAMEFLDRVFKGCHDLMILGEYRMAAGIFDSVCRLRFTVVEALASDRFVDDSPFTLKHADDEGMLSKDIRYIGADWAEAVIRNAKGAWDGVEKAWDDDTDGPVNITDEPRNYADEFRSVTDEFRSVTDEFRSVTDEFRNVTDEFRNVTDELRNVTDDPRNITDKPRNRTGDSGNDTAKDRRERIRDLAEKMIEIFLEPVCCKIFPSLFMEEGLPIEVFQGMRDILSAEISEKEEAFAREFSGNRFSLEQIMFDRSMERRRELVLDLKTKCIQVMEKEAQEGDGRRQGKAEKRVSVLEASWKQIGELLTQLSYEAYIDDQLEISEIWKICEALIRRERFDQEDWTLRRRILEDMASNDFYNEYGCCDPMWDLAKKLCLNREEFLAFADILDRFSYYKKKAAELYRQYGREDKYVSYLEAHLGKEKEHYLALIEYYKEHQDPWRARQVGERALEKCKEDLTEIFIFLLKDALENGESERYNKLYASAKRRRAAHIVRIDKALSQ